jgi:hypothetical protein
VVLCRECDRLLLRTPDSCPWCRARRPGAHLRAAARPHRLDLWLLAPAVSAPALVAGDVAARWLLGTG